MDSAESASAHLRFEMTIFCSIFPSLIAYLGEVSKDIQSYYQKG